MHNSNTISIDDTRFIFATNFSGNPDLDRFHDDRRKANIVVHDLEQVQFLMDEGFNVKQTKPRDDDEEYQPEYYVTALLKYRRKNGDLVKYPPKVYLVSGGNDPVPLDEDTVSRIDSMRVQNVNVVLNIHDHEDTRNGGITKSLYIRYMYVEQAIDDDPYAERYRRRAI